MNMVMTRTMNFPTMEDSNLTGGISFEFIRETFNQKFETPVLFISRGEIVRNYNALKAALPRADIHYAVKSNNHQVILDEIFSCGGNFDVCSAGEVDRAIKAGVKPQDLMHSLPVKPVHEFDNAVGRGVNIFVVDNPDEIQKLSRYRDKKLKIMIRYRINTNTTAVVNLQYKFGCTVDDVLPLAHLIREAGHEFYGLSFHIGSQCIYSENYVKAITTAGELIKELDMAGFKTSILNIGGGFPVEYVEPIPGIEEFCQPIGEALDDNIRPDIKIICEPGRFISASPVTLICSIVGKSLRDGKMWYYLDDGLYSTFSGIVFDHCQYPVITNRTGEEKLSVLAGPTCDSFDVMYDGLMIPEHHIGDMLIFPMTGAYCAVSGSDFNSLRRPEYKIID
ncbi:MAG: type III PLP-dependent enzyme [candidate division Zixibacteria bacterium]|nr:type III PLP-dependent enzyme [candidate division Zixibacteria bacterium]